MTEANEKVLDLINMGIGLMSQQKYTEAKPLFVQALRLDPECFDAYMHLGNANANLGDYEGAVQAFSNALVLKPDDGEVLFSMGNAYYLNNDFQKALKYYNKAEANGFVTVDLYMIMADIFEKAEDSEQVLRCLNKALKVAPLRGDLWRHKIVLLIARGSNDAALEALDEFTNLLPDAYDAYELQSRLYLQLDRKEDAGKVVEKAVERFPEDPNIRMIELNYYVETQEFEKAEELIKVFRERNWTEGRRKTIAMLESKVFLADGRVNELPKEFDWALEESKEDPELLYLLLTTHLSTLNFAEVVKAADRIIAVDGISPSVLAPAKFYRATSLQELGKTEEAAAELKKLTKELRKITIQQPGLYDVYMYRLMCHCSLKEFDKALELADYLQNVAPDRADGHAYKYIIYKQMGDTEKAEQELAEARKIDPNVKA